MKEGGGFEQNWVERWWEGFVWKRNKGEGVMDKTSIFFLLTQTET
jgi:hypothetical protein